MMDEKERTGRGFRIFGRVPTTNGGSIRIQESSLAYEGAHVWLFLDGEECKEHLGQHIKPDPHLNVNSAKLLVAALGSFIAEAETDQLMEPTQDPPHA